MVDAHLKQSRAHRLGIAGIALLKSANPGHNPRRGPAVSEGMQPSPKFSGLTNFDHKR
jgi:hypothetical protein